MSLSGRRHFIHQDTEEWRFVPGKKSFPGMKNIELLESKYKYLLN